LVLQRQVAFYKLFGISQISACVKFFDFFAGELMASSHASTGLPVASAFHRMTAPLLIGSRNNQKFA
jgi:hypothetical protein